MRDQLLFFTLLFYRERVFAVNSEDGVGGNVFIIDRSNGHLIQKFHQLHSYGILGVRIFENSILATADLGGYIKFIVSK